jgi:hypothetical protein
MSLKDRFKMAGSQLVKGNFGNAIKSLSVAESSFSNLTFRQAFAPGNESGTWFFGAGPGGEDLHFSFSSLKDAINAYQRCPPVAAIINRKAQAHINGKTFILNTSGKARDKEATGEVAIRLRNLLAKPNPLQSWSQFEAMMKVYITLFGFCPILAIRPVGFDATYAKALWILPPFLLDIQESEEMFYNRKGSLIKSIEITYRGKTSNLDPDDVFFVKDVTISLSSLALPQSRIKSLAYPINNAIGAYISKNVLINRRGALGILSNGGKDAMGALPLSADDKKEVQDDLMRYGLMHNQWQVVVTNASLQWQQMGYPTKELMLFEEIEAATMALCDGLGYQYRCLNENSSNSLGGSDVNEFRKMVYTDHVIPEAQNIYEQLNNFFELSKYNLVLEKDFTHLAVLQEDEVKKAMARFNRSRAMMVEFQNNLITLNEWRKANGDDPITKTEDGDDFGNLYYSKLLDLGWKFGPGGGTPPPADNGNNENNSGNGN